MPKRDGGTGSTSASGSQKDSLGRPVTDNAPSGQKPKTSKTEDIGGSGGSGSNQRTGQ